MINRRRILGLLGSVAAAPAVLKTFVDSAAVAQTAPPLASGGFVKGVVGDMYVQMGKGIVSFKGSDGVWRELGRTDSFELTPGTKRILFGSSPPGETVWQGDLTYYEDNPPVIKRGGDHV